MVKGEGREVTWSKSTIVFGNEGISCLLLTPHLCRISHVMEHVCDCNLFLAAQLLVFHKVPPLCLPPSYSYTFSGCVLFVFVTRACCLPRLASNSCPACFSLPIYGIAGVHHYTQTTGFFPSDQNPSQGCGKFPTQCSCGFSSLPFL